MFLNVNEAKAIEAHLRKGDPEAIGGEVLDLEADFTMDNNEPDVDVRVIIKPQEEEE